MRKGGVYLAIGDSWTWAKNTSTTLGSQFYATQIRNAIRSNYGACRLINKGIGGTDSNRMVVNLPWISQVEADLITIAVGTNDCANGSISVATYQSNLEKIVDAIKQKNPNAHIILCTPGQTLDSARSPYIQAYRDAMSTVGINKGVSVCHFENAWASENSSANMEADNIHPNATGHIALFNILYPIVQTGSWLEKLE